MTTLADLLGVDQENPDYQRAQALVREDHRFLRELIALRKARKLSQDDVAKLIGISQPTVAAFERFDSDPKLSTIRRYAQAVGLLVCHHVEVDEGQIAAGGWPPVAWVEVPAVRFEPDLVTQPGSESQQSVPVPHDFFALAA